jgi:rSAM/selenodomain-associated transferase 2
MPRKMCIEREPKGSDRVLGRSLPGSSKAESSLSIIIPTLNEQETVKDCLLPLQPLRKMGVEVIISDGGSTDQTRGIAEPYVDQVFQSEPGRARQMNAGAALANGTHLLFLHADTFLPPDFSVTSLRDAQWGFFSVNLSGSLWQLRIIERAMNLRSRITRIGTGDQAIFVRSELFHTLGGFADIPLMEDVELCGRLKAVCPPSLGRNCVMTSSRRWERQGVTRTVLQMWCLRLAYFLGVSPNRLMHQYYPEYKALNKSLEGNN